MSSTSIRGKDWVFNAFWAAAGEGSAPKCLLQIPVTFIFREDRPFKALGTDISGTIQRISLEDVELDRNDTDNGFRGEYYRTIRAMRNVLIDFSVRNGYSDVQQKKYGKVNICNVSIVCTSKMYD